MDLFEAMDYSRDYEPPAIYELTEIKRNHGKVNHLHTDMLNCRAYPLFLQEGERGWFCVEPVYDDKFHRVHTSPVKSFTPWGHGEDTVTVETMHTTYVFAKANQAEGLYGKST